MTFPLLSSGAVTQYKLPMGVNCPVAVVRFLDGTDQRFPTRRSGLRRWLINLALLNEQELSNLESFFTQTSGEYLLFGFPDPISGRLVPNCRFGRPEIETNYLGDDIGSTALWVIETNG